MNAIAKDYSPSSLEDVVVASTNSRSILDRLENGTYPLPNGGKFITLFGPYGTGKTTLAKMLPKFIERAYFPASAVEEPTYLFIDCLSGGSGAQDIKNVAHVSQFPPLNANLHYVICDEIDTLSESSQTEIAELKSRRDVLWIFTTNNPSGIIDDLRSLGPEISLGCPPDAKIAKLAQTIATGLGTEISAAQAERIARSCGGSWRQVEERTHQLVAQIQPTNTVALTNNLTVSQCPPQPKPTYSSFAEFAPKTIEDVLFADHSSRLVVDRILKGLIRPPSDRCLGFLIFGDKGTGRSTLAKLLPNTIEAIAFGGDSIPFESDSYHCETGHKGIETIRKIRALVNVHVFGNKSGLRYISLESVENLCETAQLELKSLMNRPRVVFILVTNSLAGINAGVRDRCSHHIYMPAPKGKALQDLIERMAIAKGKAMDTARISALSNERWESFQRIYDVI